VVSIIAPNGPAIKRAERIETALWAVLAKEPACREDVLFKELILVSSYFSRPARLNDVSRSGGEAVPEQTRHGVLFAVMVQSLLRAGALCPP
jgi:hypothetical protein